MNLKKFFLAGAALSVALTSCNKDESINNGGNEEGKMVPLTLTVESDALTKAISGNIDDGHPVAFEGGRIYFTNKYGHVATTYPLTSYKTTTELETIPVEGTAYTVDVVKDSVAIQDLRDSKTLTYLVAESAVDGGAVYVFGNVGNINLPEGGHIDNYIGSIKASMTTQTDAKGGVESAFLFGAGDITEVIRTPGSGTTPPLNTEFADYEAEVEVAPISTRLELAKVTGLTTPSTSNSIIALAAYDIDGLFLNHFYGEGTINGTTNDADFVAYTSLDDFSMNGLTTPWYNYIYNGFTFDYDGTNGITRPEPAASRLIYVPSEVKNTPPASPNYLVWGYNMFAAESKVPHLVLKLKNVKVTVSGVEQDLKDVAAQVGLPSQDEYYITIKRYSADNGVTQLTEFKKGHVYTVENLPFTIDNIKEVPEWEDDIIVNVTITVVDWTKVPVTVDLD